MTTTVKVITNTSHCVLVTRISPEGSASLGAVQVNPGEIRDFYVHQGQDLRIHEIQPDAPQQEPATHFGLPVSGYRPQSPEAVARVNAMKQMEERALRALDALAADPDIDKRWLAIGRTSIEQGFMAVNRSIFQPARVEIEE